MLQGALSSSAASAARTALKHFRNFVTAGALAHPFVVPTTDGDLAAAQHNETTLMQFAAFLADKDIAAGTVLSYCSHVRAHVSDVGGFAFSARTTRWRRLAKAIKRQLGRERAKCRPLRASHLRAAAREAACLIPDTATCQTRTSCHPRVLEANRQACLATGWQALARVTELTSLTRAHLEFKEHPRCAVVWLFPLKKQPGQHRVPVLLAPGDESGADAYAALRTLEAVDPVPPERRAHTPLFRGPRRLRALNGQEVTRWVQRAAASAGDSDDAHFSARSLRIGGATEMHALGVNPASIQAMGRWAGDTQRIYTRMPAANALGISASMSAAPANPALEDLFPTYTQTRR